MKLKTSFLKETAHSGIVTGLAWNSSDEVYSCGDDHVIMKWNYFAKEATKVCNLPDDLFPTGIQWFPKSGTKKNSLDLLLVTSTDGKFHFVSKNGRIERSFDAHQGAILVGLWSYDGAGLLTGGEDGQVKIWSKGGMLRSTIISGDVPIYAAAWSPDSNAILVAQGRSLMIKPLAPNSKSMKWRAHEGLILTVSWNPCNNQIVSGGEDCRYKVWQALSGHCLYTSGVFEHPVASIGWSPIGDTFAVTCFNTLQLCDKVGWSYSLEKLQCRSIYTISWSSDGTQLAAGCGNGFVIFGHIIERKLHWKNYEATLAGRRKVFIHDVQNEVEEKLEFSERIVRMCLGFDHFIATTPSQCHIFSVNHWNTPAIFDLKDGPGSLILMSLKNFLIVGGTTLNIYNYDGKLQESPKVSRLQTDTLDPLKISLSPDTLVHIDQSDEKSIQIIDLTGRQSTLLPPMQHTLGIVQVALSQTGNATDRQLAYIDKNQDLFVGNVRSNRDSRRYGKISSMVQTIVWCRDSEILSGLQDTTLCVWFYPQVIYVDKFLIKKTCWEKDLSDIGKSLLLLSFDGNIIRLRRSDGSVFNQLIPASFANLHAIIAKGQWETALRLCCSLNDDLLWAGLACSACSARELNIAEEAYSALGEMDKVAYLQKIKKMSNKSAQMAYMALLSGNTYSAEVILTQSGLIYPAIALNMQMYNWKRALDLAVKHRIHVDTVLYKRKCYLEALNKEESNEHFMKYFKEIQLNEDTIRDRIVRDSLKEINF